MFVCLPIYQNLSFSDLFFYKFLRLQMKDFLSKKVKMMRKNTPEQTFQIKDMWLLLFVAVVILLYVYRFLL